MRVVRLTAKSVITAHGIFGEGDVIPAGDDAFAKHLIENNMAVELERATGGAGPASLKAFSPPDDSEKKTALDTGASIRSGKAKPPASSPADPASPKNKSIKPKARK